METAEGEICLPGMNEERGTGENHIVFSTTREVGGVIWIFEIRTPTPITNPTTLCEYIVLLV